MDYHERQACNGRWLIRSVLTTFDIGSGRDRSYIWIASPGESDRWLAVGGTTAGKPATDIGDIIEMQERWLSAMCIEHGDSWEVVDREYLEAGRFQELFDKARATAQGELRVERPGYEIFGDEGRRLGRVEGEPKIRVERFDEDSA